MRFRKLPRLIVATLITATLSLALSCGAGSYAKQKSAQNADSLRIVVLSPEVAEIVAALGSEGQIVGVADACDYPAGLRKKQIVGSFSHISAEKIVALKPDLVFVSGLEQDGIATDLGKLGLQVHKVYPGSLRELPEVILRIGSLIGRQAEAQSQAAEIGREVAAIRTRTANLPKVKVYLEIYANPLMSVADNSFVGELIETAGGDNIFSQLERDYARVNSEDVVKAQPEVIICYSQQTPDAIRARKGWQDIPAVRNDRLYFERDIDPSLIQRATPRTVLGLKRLYEILHSEVSDGS